MGAESSRGGLMGMATGVLFMAFFGTMWALIGIFALQGWLSPLPLLLCLASGLGLLFGGFRLLQAAQRAPADPAAPAQPNNTNRWFGLIFGLEGVAIFIASILCNRFDRFDLFFPIMALIVGIHFFPLAALFHYPGHYLTGALISILGLLALTVIPATITLSGRDLSLPSLVLGFGCALILWATGFSLWLRAQQ